MHSVLAVARYYAGGPTGMASATPSGAGLRVRPHSPRRVPPVPPRAAAPPTREIVLLSVRHFPGILAPPSPVLFSSPRVMRFWASTWRIGTNLDPSEGRL